MRRVALLAIVHALVLAGCSARGGNEDPWAYTKKPLYAGGFSLERIAGHTDSQEFRVTDGSIAAVRVLVWINATQGGGTVRVSDPGGHVVLSTSDTADQSFGLQLGRWVVEVEGLTGSAGTVHVLAVRG